MIYRWVVALYFVGWLIASGRDPKFFIYLTNWSFLALNVHLIYAALSTTVDYFKVYLCCKHHYNDLNFERDADEFDIVEPKGCFSRKYNQIKWYHMIQWVLFTVGTQAAVTVVILYWGLLFRGGSVDVFNGHIHLANGLVGILDMWVSGLPVRLLHFYMLQTYAATYTSFTGIYYAAGGTGYNGTSYIYSPLDYEGSPGSAAGICIGVLLFIPIVHLLFYSQYVGRYWLVYLIYGRQKMRGSRVSRQDEKLKMNPMTNMTDDS